MTRRLSLFAAIVFTSALSAAPALDRQEPLTRLGRAPFGHGHDVFGLCFTPDGKRIVTAGYDHRARLWDLATGDEIRAFGDPAVRVEPFSPSRWVYAAAVSPDGRTLATSLLAGGWQVGSVTLWDIEKGTASRTIEIGRTGVSVMAFSADGATLLAGTGEGGGEAGRWDVATGREFQRVRFDAGAVQTKAAKAALARLGPK